VQIRRGPNVWGLGLFQSSPTFEVRAEGADHSRRRQKGVFLLAPLVSCVLALAAWAVIPMNLGWVISDINVGVL